jgi:hypothetical protein
LSRWLRSAALFTVLLCAASSGVAGPAQHPAPDGEILYRHGQLPTGALLAGSRDFGANVTGETAACVNCHRRSGLGNVEGNIVIPPIIAKYLYRTRQANVLDLTLPHVPGFTPNGWAYTDETLAQVIRTGVRPNGQPLNALMPRYALDDESMAALIGYLKNLTSEPVPGVTDTTLHFATIVTPDADPVEKKAMLEVLQRFFAMQRDVIAAESRPMRASREIMYRVTRRWQLHVWELTGAPETWQGQLEDYLATEPVFAVISGMGRREWSPVHRFCEHNSIPCLLPNVDLPVVADSDFYPVYYSRGVLLEADLIAAHLFDSGALQPRRLVQVYRSNDIGAAAAEALATRAKAANIAVEQRVVPATPESRSASSSGAALKRAIAGVDSNDALVLWLRESDLAALRGDPPARSVYISGLMGGLESAPLPVRWRAATRMAYPYDLPELRRVRMNFPLGWFKVQGIPVTAERVQTNTYLACVILSETLGHMLDSFVRDFLLERMEMMLSRRLVNGYFPRLGLAPGQRFASKGGYLVRLPATAGDKVLAEGAWSTP